MPNAPLRLLALTLATLTIAAGATAARAQAPAPDGAGPVPLAELGPGPDLAPETRPAAAGPDATDTLDASQDTFISSAQANSNFGGSTRLYVGEKSPYGATRSAVQFDLSQIARNRAVTSARLRLFLREAGPPGDRGRDIPIYRITSGWSEGGLTWNTCNDCVDGRRWSTVNMGTATGWYEWTATELVQRWRWPSWQSWSFRNHGFGVQGFEAEGSFRGFDSREGSNDPQLSVDSVVDTWLPSSALQPMQAFVTAPDSGRDYVTLRLRWDGTDPNPATGIDFFWVLVKVNTGTYNGLTSSSNSPADAWRRYDTDFRGYNGKVYNFVTYATDMAGNREPNKPNPDWITHVDWSAPTTTMTALPPFVRGNIQLNWTGQDLPQGPDLFPAGIASYQVWFNVNNSSWGLAETLPADRTSTVFVNPLANASYQFQIVGIDRAGNTMPVGPAQAQTFVDFTPPTVVMNPIVKPLPQTTFSVSWSGSDGIGSGLANFDVQTATGNGEWRAWQTATTATSASFTGQLGNVYGFRVRATDRAGNTSAWSAPQWATVVNPADLKHQIELPLTYR